MTKAGVVLAFLGLIWLLQGIGVMGGDSRMAGDPVWAVAGMVAMAVGLPASYLHLIRFK